MSARLRRAVPEAAICGYFVALSVAWWWPLALHLRDGQIENPPIDPAYNQWILGWGSHALLHAPWDYLDANAYHPSTAVLAWGDNLFALAVLTVPLRALVGIVGAYNVLLLASSALTGYFTHRFLRVVGLGRAAAVLGGTIAAFSSFRVTEYGHLQILSTQWIPLVFLFAERFRQERRPLHLAALTATLAVLLATNLYLTIFTAISFGLWLVAAVVVERRTGRWRALLIAGGATWAAASLVVLPLYLPSLRVQREAGIVRSIDEQHGSTVEAFDPRPPPGSLAGRVAGRVGLDLAADHIAVQPPNYATPGFVTLAALGAGLVHLARRRRRPAGLWTGVAFGAVAVFAAAASLGPSISWRGEELVAANPAFHVPYRWLPGYEVLRVPTRWLVMYSLGLGVVAAVVAAPALGALRRRWRVLLVAVAGVLVVIEQSAAPWTVGESPTLEQRPARAWLAQQPAGQVVLELPIEPDMGLLAAQQMEAERLLLSASHLQRRVNGGISPYLHPDYLERASILRRLGDDPAALALVRRLQVDLVVFVPHDQLRFPDRPPPDEVERRLDATEGLTRLRTFADAVVYRVDP